MQYPFSVAAFVLIDSFSLCFWFWIWDTLQKPWFDVNINS